LLAPEEVFMSYTTRHLLHIVTRSALPLVVVTCCTVAVSRDGTGFWATPSSEDRASSPAAEEVAGVIRRIDAKEELGREVVAGRLALVDAAARFRELDEQPPKFHYEEFRDSHPGMTDDECRCREVILFLRSMLAARGERDSPVVSRLEEELQAHLERRDLRLPPRG
jgi:hypothetical protein